MPVPRLRDAPVPENAKTELPRHELKRNQATINHRNGASLFGFDFGFEGLDEFGKCHPDCLAAVSKLDDIHAEFSPLQFAQVRLRDSKL